MQTNCSSEKDKREKEWTQPFSALPVDLKAAQQQCLGESGLLGKHATMWVDSQGLRDHQQRQTQHTPARTHFKV